MTLVIVVSPGHDVVQEPGRVELCKEDGEGARDGQGVALVVLQGVSAVPGGEAELIDGEFDGGMFEV